jgi:toxin-antitoxin system PIN domain toxin
MLMPDANVLLYAVNADSDHHEEAKRWLDAVLGNPVPIGFTWVVLLAFLRITTRAGIFPHPLTVEQATDAVDGWLSQPAAMIVSATPRQMGALRGLLEKSGTGGNLVTDAHLATLALEHDAQIITYDGDFGRFPGVRHGRPTAPPADDDGK